MQKEITPYARGKMGEDRAEHYLQDIGLTTVCRRYKAQDGEIDLVMTEGTVLAMIEVKARSRGTAADAENAVTPRKQKRLCHAALAFLGEHPEYAAFPVRFDVITLTGEGIRYIRNAFECREWE